MRGLHEITLPDSVTSIGKYVCSESLSLKHVKLSSSMTKIPYQTFMLCTGLETIIFPKSIKSIDYCAFYNCFNLKDVYYTGTIDEWENISIEDPSYYSNINIASLATTHFNDILSDNVYTTEKNTSTKYEYIYYKILEDDTIEITGYVSNLTDVFLPDQIYDKTVTKLSDGLFYHNKIIILSTKNI